MTSANQVIAFVTGGNAGIGLAVVNQLARDHGYHVIVGSRNASAGEAVAANLKKDGFPASSVQLDVTSDESIAGAVRWIEDNFGMLDVLINNAGTIMDYVPGITDAYKDLSTRELFSQTFNTNIIGTACLTEACLPLLRKAKAPRLVFVSSRMGSLSEATNKSTPFYANDYKSYDCSKAAMNMLALNYARILESNGGLVNAVCPGLVQTKLTNFTAYGALPEVGAQRIVELATAGEGGPTATFSDRDGVIPW